MKRYSPNIESIKQVDGIKVYGVSFDEKPYGEWVKHEDVKTMYDALIHIEEYWNGSCASAVDAIEEAQETAKQALDRVREGGE